MMPKLLKISIRVLFVLAVIALIHFFVFPQETRCMAIKLSGFKKTGNIYYKPGTPPEQIAALQKLKIAAENTVKEFWNSNARLDYVFVYCNTTRDFDRYGVAGVPAATRFKGGAYIILQEQSLDKDIIAHEISHAVLYRNIGWYKTKFKIPTWFDEGLAMQVDNRDYYSIDTLMEKRKRGTALPDVQHFDKPTEFFAT